MITVKIAVTVCEKNYEIQMYRLFSKKKHDKGPKYCVYFR